MTENLRIAREMRTAARRLRIKARALMLHGELGKGRLAIALANYFDDAAAAARRNAHIPRYRTAWERRALA